MIRTDLTGTGAAVLQCRSAAVKYVGRGFSRAVFAVASACVFAAGCVHPPKYEPPQIRHFFEQHGLVIQEWDRIRTDWVTIRSPGDPGEPTLSVVA